MFRRFCLNNQTDLLCSPYNILFYSIYYYYYYQKFKKIVEEQKFTKKMLFYFETYNPLTKRIERFGRSVMRKDDWNNTRKAMKFLEIIREYLADCGLEMPDSEEYKHARDLAPTR